MIPIKIISHKQLKVIWQVTTACTYKCDYCPKELHEGTSKKIDLDELSVFLDKLVSKQPTFILSGGEPTIHPQFIDIVSLLKSRNINVISDTNLSRTTRFYEEASNFVDNWCVTLHPQEHTLDIEKIKTLTDKSFTVIYLMADPRFWDKSMLWWDELKKIPRIKAIVLKPLDNWSNSGWYYNEYTENQIKFYEGTSPIVNFSKLEIQERLPQYSWLADQGSDVVWNDGTTSTLDPDQLMKDNLNKFKGWKCEAGEEVIVLGPECDISLATCGVKRLGHYRNFNLETLQESTICPYEYCHCGTDIKATKYKE